MGYLIAIIFPPAAMLLAGKPMQALINGGLLLSALLFPPIWLIAVIWAVMVVSSSNADRRTKRVVDEVRRQGEAARREARRQGPR